jgi:hypothetical protein
VDDATVSRGSWAARTVCPAPTPEEAWPRSGRSPPSRERALIMSTVPDPTASSSGERAAELERVADDAAPLDALLVDAALGPVRGGATHPAPERLGGGGLTLLAEAPGTYVFDH